MAADATPEDTAASAEEAAARNCAGPGMPQPPGRRMDADRAVVDGPRVLAALQENRAELKLDTADLCFLVGLRLRAERSAIAAFEEETLLDVYEQICDLTDPDAANPRKRATHAIERFRQQRLLARVDGNGAVQAGEYAMTPLATAIIDFFLQEEGLTRPRRASPFSLAP